jgi:hypothetical protein
VHQRGIAECVIIWLAVCTMLSSEVGRGGWSAYLTRILGIIAQQSLTTDLTLILKIF